MTPNTRETILIVDDLLDNRNLLSRILQNDGYQVEMAEDGAEAIRVALETLPDLILLDMSMPVMDGIETCQRLKKDKRTRDIPVIFISALGDIDNKVKAFDAGGVDYILKPFEIEEIQARLNAHLAILRLRLQLQATNRELATRLAELSQSQELLHERERKLAAFINAMPNLSFVYDQEGHYLEILTSQTDLLVANVEEMKGRRISDLTPPQEAKLMLDTIHRAIETGETQVIEYKVPVLAGGEHWFEGRVALMEKDDAGQSKVVFIATEISERVALYQEVQKLAIHDPLTGCLNRRHFLTLAGREWEHATRYQRPLSLLMIDVDFFKKFNDRYGHPVGDQILCALVNHCETQLRQVDVFSRYGGEEFIILMPETNLEDALQAGERIRAEIENLTAQTSAGKLSLTISVGVAGFAAGQPNPPTIDELILLADQGLYAAKAAGRNCVKTSKN